jgi:hypothetical protein
MADAVTSSVIRGVLHMSYVVCFTCHTWCASHVIRDVLHMRYLNYNDCSQSILVMMKSMCYFQIFALVDFLISPAIFLVLYYQ